jgi:hypothetical protein
MVRHIRPIGRRDVVAANEFQDFVCRFSALFNALLGFFGGSSPVGLWIDSKCAIPTANTTGGTTTTA